MKKVIQVCSTEECDNLQVNEQVGSGRYNFCCRKGYEKSLQEFNKFIGKKENAKSTAHT